MFSALRGHIPLLLVLGGCLIPAPASPACTVFADAQDGMVLAGRNWDMTECQPVMWLVPAQEGMHGRVCFGRHDDCEDGMNDQGLFAAVAASPPSGRFKSSEGPIGCPAALDFVLAHCATVDEAIAWWEKHPNLGINNTIARQSFLGIRYGNAYVNSGVGGHILIADRSGNSVVCEWIKGKFTVIRKTGRYQLITNFLLSRPNLGNTPCFRFAAVTKVLNRTGHPSMDACDKALKAASTEFTRYSLVCDLAHGDIQVCCSRRFDNPRLINLDEELRKGAHEVDLRTWFSTGLEARRKGAEPL